MSKVVECVPNFSEGRNQKVIDAISSAISGTKGITLLDVDPGKSTNRTVYTFVGQPDDVVAGALNAALEAQKHIDMRLHKGEHPRMGALDVCPFIPVRGVTIDECIDCAQRFGEALANALDVPVFLYGEASKMEYRKTMPQIRAGEYEGLEDKLTKPEWKPDFGPAKFVPQWGATVTGVRKFLIAYNVNILGTKEQAHRIALNLREQGRSPSEPGRLKNCQAIGWWLDEQKIAQVSINLTDYEVTTVHVAFEEAKKEAEKLQVAVIGSEIVGLVPLESLLRAAKYYMEKDNLFILEEEQKIHLVVNRLGLHSMGRFDPKKRIIEYNLDNCASNSVSLCQKKVEDFIRCVAARSPAPGGGSVAALVASLGAALATMVGLLTYGKRQWESLDAQTRQIIPPIHSAIKTLTLAIDADTQAFNSYLEALKLPKTTEEQQKEHDIRIRNAVVNNVNVPLNLAKTIGKIWSPLTELANIGNLATKSDLQVAAHCLKTGVWGAYFNVCINVEGLPTDDAFRCRVMHNIDKEVENAEKNCKNILDILSRRTN